MTAKRKKLIEEPFFVDDEVEELKAEIARLRGALQAIAKLAKINVTGTPEYMINDAPPTSEVVDVYKRW
jgi:hypothetical protein